MKGATPVIPAYLYARVSSLTQTSDGHHGIERQVETLTQWLEHANSCIDEASQRANTQLPHIDVENVTQLTDQGYSAYKSANFEHGKLGLLYQQCVEGRLGSCWLIVENIDRISRATGIIAIHRISTMLLNGVNIFEIETNSCFSTLINDSCVGLSISLQRAFQESERKSIMSKKSFYRRIKEYRECKKPLINSKKHIPRWIDIVDGEYQPNELAKTINFIFEMYNEGHGNAVIVQRLKELSLKDHNETNWNTIKISQLLRDERVIGVLKNKNKKNKENYHKIEGIWPKIISENLFNSVQSKINRHPSSHIDRTTKKQQNLFNGIIKCLFCNKSIAAIPNGKGVVYLRCTTHRSKDDACKLGLSLNADIIDPAIINFINGINWEEVYSISNKEKSDVEKLRLEYVNLTNEISELISEINDADDRIIMRLSRLLGKKQQQQSKIESKINSIKVNYNIKNVDIKTTQNIFNRKNISIRQNLNLELKKIIKTLKLGKLSDTFALCELEYFTDKISHLLIINLKKSIVTSWGVYRKRNDDSIWFESNFITFEVNNPTNTGWPKDIIAFKESLSSSDLVLFTIMENTIIRAYELIN
ncbi:Recombinase [Edwardsiella tarda]|uniref:Recombinase family protein n=2 Tax=Edwardsiella tarda TaxID=636 RepID=A0AC61TG93_EDWTA|nr:recombinase family protein [Edwardsiella tarda]UAL57258.1 recombinase family protein [Edwardsiella tarda]UCP99690.1 recombinase family protein [Edwardsiella tarda ATCC 15947 = NBRC 105688]STD30714.1 Recombinase [Edwardsiella tarda]